MAIYEVTDACLRELEPTSFAESGMKERSDLQRLLRMKIDVVSPDTKVIAEEFGDWEDSKRRIDLLGVDRNANLVVIELKRSDDGGHMELQAIRYAAMISTMTFENAVEVYAEYLVKIGSQEDARTSLLSWLKWDEVNEDEFAQDVRIILVSADFSKELTTAVMWLNDRDLEIRCVRMKPYSDGGKLLVDVQVVIPLPELADYTVHIREKDRAERKVRAERFDLRKRFWAELLKIARSKTDLHANIAPSEDTWVSAGSGVGGIQFMYNVNQHAASVMVYIYKGVGRERETKEIFDSFYKGKEQIEADFGKPLKWERLDTKQTSKIVYELAGGYRDDEQQRLETQEDMVDKMILLEKAFRPCIENIKSKGLGSGGF